MGLSQRKRLVWQHELRDTTASYNLNKIKLLYITQDECGISIPACLLHDTKKNQDPGDPATRDPEEQNAPSSCSACPSPDQWPGAHTKLFPPKWQRYIHGPCHAPSHLGLLL